MFHGFPLGKLVTHHYDNQNEFQKAYLPYKYHLMMHQVGCRLEFLGYPRLHECQHFHLNQFSQYLLHHIDLQSQVMDYFQVLFEFLAVILTLTTATIESLVEVEASLTTVGKFSVVNWVLS